MTVDTPVRFIHWLEAAMDENFSIISLGDRSKNFMVNLPACVFDILTVIGLTNLIINPTHFSGNSETLIDPILVTCYRQRHYYY